MGEVAHAQATARPTATFEAEVVDSQTGQPIRRVVLWGRSAASGSRYGGAAIGSGVIRIESIVPGVPVWLSVDCGGSRRSRQRMLDSTTITFEPGESRRWRVRAAANDCDQRPFIDSVGVFAGRWRTGFEESSFSACDSAFGKAWASRARDATEVPGIVWPGVKANEDYREVFIRVEGRLQGPWHYGHMGVSEFALAITRVLEVLPWSETACSEKPG